MFLLYAAALTACWSALHADNVTRVLFEGQAGLRVLDFLLPCRSTLEQNAAVSLAPLTILKSITDKKSVTDKNDAPRLAAFLHDSSDEETGEFREPHSAMDHQIHLGCNDKSLKHIHVEVYFTAA